MGRGLTKGEILKRLGPDVRPWQFEHAVSVYGIAPIDRLGIIRLWAEEDIDRIKSALRRTAERRGGRDND